MSRECDVRVREHGGYGVVVEPALASPNYVKVQ
ncbi:hypothetical protein At15955_44600 [Agrobacterium tumefaciens]|jgi:hypothetical protein|nr:hypothetical protein Ach5_45280 [Agrobacterium tumefaciens]AYM19445.1 hypothetical protein At15955_44600 [Agrobacterium tumefaciens]AYM70746.1 hypothetical protein AtA6_45300 [Agrobacterium tumefaciens]MDP9562710.1 hypothetical protein [Rhizobium nepotum]TWC78608.1 hypothetical protein FB593_111132 [Rhizobium sp. SJZ105]